MPKGFELPETGGRFLGDVVAWSLRAMTFVAGGGGRPLREPGAQITCSARKTTRGAFVWIKTELL